MNETVMEVPKREEENLQHGTPEGQAEAGRPSERQRSYLAELAQRVGVRIDLSKVQSSAAASRLIGQLQVLDARMNGRNGRQDIDIRDKRIAFGMATKLVYKKYLERHKEVRRSKKFWEEVVQLYQDYQREQERVTAAPSIFSTEADALR